MRLKQVPPMPELSPLAVGAQEAAALIGVSRSTFLRLASIPGRVPGSYRIFGRRLWRVQDLQRWVADRFEVNA